MIDDPAPVPVVAIGASAGGLEPLRALFANMPTDLGAAYVVLTHSDPRRESMLGDLLGRCTELPVCDVADQLELRPDHVYVSPTGDSLRLDGHLLQHDPDTGGSSYRRLPIDRFFRSVARHRGPRAIGVLLSGSGSDGTQGAKEIRGHGGLVITQDRSEAQYDGMPWSAVQAEAVDAEVPIAQIPERIARYLKNLPPLHDEPDAAPSAEDRPDVERLVEHLETQHGHDFSGYKRNTIQRRMHKRMLVAGCDAPDDYLARLREDPKESEAMFRDLFIGVSSFFRDPEAFAALEQAVLPPIVEAHADGAPLRAWVPGCSSGEEAFSLTMLLFEENKRQRRQAPLQIFGTDVDGAAIERARTGVYPENIAQDVEESRLNRHFDREDGAYRVGPHIREPVVFARHDVLSDPPFVRLDLVSCRNLLIYLSAEAQDRLIPLFHYALQPGGFLFLGPSESVGRHTDLFEIVDKRWKIFRRKQTRRRAGLDFPSQQRRVSRPSPARSESGVRQDFRQIMEQQLLQHLGRPAILLDGRGAILSLHGDLDPYLRVPAGSPTNDVDKVAREHVRVPLRSALHRVHESGAPVTIRGIPQADQPGSTFDLTAHPIDDPKIEDSLRLVLFEPPVLDSVDSQTVSAAPDLSRDDVVRDLENQVTYLRDELRRTIDDQDTANEELESSNEELMSMNEELQSTNEELETSKEELQSVNEELASVNGELQAKVEELAEVNADVENLLKSTRIATVFLDRALVIRQFTPSAAEIFNIVKADVGRPLFHLTSRLDTPIDLDSECKAVLRDLGMTEREVSTTDGREYLVRITPYRGRSDALEGVVLTFVDITERRRLEDEVRRHRDHLEELVEEKSAELVSSERKLSTIFRQSHASIVLLRESDHRIVDANPAFCALLGRDREQVVGSSAAEIFDEAWLGALSSRIQAGGKLDNEALTVPGAGGELRRLNAAIDRSEIGGEPLLLVTAMDVTELDAARSAAEGASQSKSRFIANLSHEIRTPLSIILGMTDLLAKGDLDLSNPRYHESLRRAGTALKSIIDGVLDLSQIEAGKARVEATSFSPRTSIEQLAGLYEAAARDRGLEFRLELDPELPEYVEADESKLHQVLRNLLSNALKFTDAGHVEVAAAHREEDGQPNLVIEVRDTGVGISADQVHELFREFGQLHHGNRKFEGSGLGLAISERIVDLLGGSLSVTSAPGEGTTFTVRVPAPVSGPSTGDLEPAEGASLGGLRVLVADDSEDGRVLIREVLGRAGAEVRVIDDGSGVLEILTSERIDVVVMDVHMPEVDGVTATERIREADQAYATIPILGITAHATPENVERMKLAGADEIVFRPLDGARLVRKIARLAAQRRSGPKRAG